MRGDEGCRLAGDGWDSCLKWGYEEGELWSIVLAVARRLKRGDGGRRGLCAARRCVWGGQGEARKIDFRYGKRDLLRFTALVLAVRDEVSRWHHSNDRGIFGISVWRPQSSGVLLIVIRNWGGSGTVRKACVRHLRRELGSNCSLRCHSAPLSSTVLRLAV